MAGGKKPRDIGKHFEYELAKRIGGTRAGYGNASTMPDVISDDFEIEAKVSSLPAKLEQALTTVKSRGRGSGLKSSQLIVIKP